MKFAAIEAATLNAVEFEAESIIANRGDRVVILQDTMIDICGY